MVRGGGTARALCAAGLLLSGLAPAAQASVRGLPGPVPGCPPQRGTAAPALAPWPQKELGFSAVWRLTRGAGVTVAVVDSGVDANPQFGDRVIVGPDLVAGTKRGIPPGADCVGHGTAVASIIAAAPMRGISFTGVAPAARILSVKISGTDTFPTSATPQGIMDAVQFGADVINLSLSTTDDVPALRQAVAYALSRNVVVVAAAGNDIPQNGAGPFYPAAYPGVLSVGAAGPGGALAPFSDRRTPVGVTAPGVNVTSAYPGTFPDAYNPDQSGTSFAAAYVSGVVALVRATHPRLSPAQVVARIEATARGSAGPGTGYGLVDPVRAVTAVLPGDPAAAPAASPGQPSPGQPSPGQTSPGQTSPVPATSAAQPGGTNRAEPRGHETSAVTRAVIAGSFGLIVVVAVTAGLAIARRHRPPGSGPGPPGSGRHAA
jgi:membrane-anchored mycosin MYCP